MAKIMIQGAYDTILPPAGRDAGHVVRLIPSIYVKPFVKRHKNDAADAEAIVEAALRPNMSFVEPKSVDKQALSMMMRTRDQLIDH